MSKSVRASQSSQLSQDVSPTPSQASQALNAEEIKVLASNIALFLISEERFKRPVRKQVIINTVLPRHGRSFKKVMEKAIEILAEVYGFSAMEVDGKYFLSNKFSPSERTTHYLHTSPEDIHEKVLLLIVLSHIFMETGCVQEDHMWKFLGSMGVGENSNYFGDVKKLLTKDFVQRMYLEHKRREGSDPPMFEFRFGRRAEVEVKKRDLLHFVSEMYGVTPDRWPAHCKDIDETE